MISNKQLDTILKWICENDKHETIHTIGTIEDFGLTNSEGKSSKTYFGSYLHEVFYINKIDTALIQKVIETFKTKGLISYTKRSDNDNDFVIQVNLEAHRFWNNGNGGFVKEKIKKRIITAVVIISTLIGLVLAALAIDWTKYF